MAVRPKTPEAKRPTGSRIPKTWHAVSIVTRGSSCEAARQLRTQRFLSSEAPRLPLPACSTPHTCTCAYKHYEDRRAAPRRKEELTGLRQQKRSAGERRMHTDRRREIDD